MSNRRKTKTRTKPRQAVGIEPVTQSPPVVRKPDGRQARPDAGKKPYYWAVGAVLVVCAVAVTVVVASGRFAPFIRQPFELWGRWAEGEQLAATRLWGWPLLSWGRLGKVCQFLAGLTIVLDLIGPGPLRAFGARLRDVSWRQLADKAEKFVVAITALFLLSYYLLLFLFIFADRFMARLGMSIGSLFGPFGIVVALLSLFGVGFLLANGWRRESSRKEQRDMFWYATKAPFFIVAAVPVGLWFAVSRGLLVPLVSGLSAVFDRAQPGHPLRWGAFALFVIGFQFDLLAS